jgi:regulator of protease activity HflC (stomatin/prohibitin superfamily)
MKKLISILFMLSVMFSMTSCLGIERVDAGCEGIEVSLYGDDRGIGEINLVTGWVIYNSFTKQIYEYPTWIQTVDYEPFSINAKDGPLFTIDPNVNIKVEDGKAPQVFKKYRKELNEVIHGPVLKYIKDACRIEINKFTTDEIVSNREKIEDAIEKRLKTTLAKEGFYLDNFTSGLSYPKSIIDAIDAKTKAVQDAQRVENELKIAEAEARKKIVAAEAEKQANELRTQALTPAILQQMWIDKWDGKLPVTMAGGDSKLLLNLPKQ